MTMLRKGEGLTQAEVAARMGVSQSRVSQIENDGPATTEQLCAYMSALRISWRITKWKDPITFPPLKKPPKTAQSLLYGP